jgi:hypothetical protein
VKIVKRFIIGASLLAPAAAFAQGFYPPTNNAETNLNPANAPAAPIPPPPPPAAAPAPQVYVVGPDGQVKGGPQAPAEQGYYINNGASTQPVDNDVELHTGPVPELHVVRTGDTLWDISYRYFANPWEWPKVWSYNPQITNPHWIYPGDLVRLLPRGVFVQAQPTQEPEGTQPVQPDPVPAPQRRVDASVKEVAFVEKRNLDEAILVDGSPDEKELLGVGDSVYLAYPKGKQPKVGDHFSIYTPGQNVVSGGNNLGSYVRLLGEIEIVSVKEDKRARGVILSSNREIQRGNKVGPLLRQFKTVPPVAPTVDAQAQIVGILLHDQMIGDGEVVFVQLGKKSGIEVGNRMYVVRRGDGYPDHMASNLGQDDRRFPARALGEIQIVDVGENVSIGLVTVSTQEMGIGDLVMMQKAASK